MQRRPAQYARRLAPVLQSLPCFEVVLLQWLLELTFCSTSSQMIECITSAEHVGLCCFV